MGLKEMEMGLLFGFQSKNQKKLIYGLPARFSVVKCRDPRFLTRFVARAVILAVIMVSFPWLNVTMIGDSSSSSLSSSSSWSNDLNHISSDAHVTLDPIFNEGIVEQRDRVLLVTSRNGGNGAAVAASDDVIRRRNGRRLLATESDAKAVALKKLEDVLLEPPRAASGKSNAYRKKTRYLPELMGVSLENYPRRVFIDLSYLSGDKSAAAASEWFAKHYPAGNAEFEMFQIEAVAGAEASSSGGSSEGQAASGGMSEWLRKNVEEMDYVVMKTVAEVAEEMVKSRAIRLVDELFLECKHQGIKKGGEKSRRAYWECLALYGMLRDEGVAVHQWWG